MKQAELLLEAIGMLDDDLLAQSETMPKKYLLRVGAMAACAALLLTAAALLPIRFPHQPQEEAAPTPSQSLPAQTTEPEVAEPEYPMQEFIWTPIYNEAELMMDASRAYLPGSFTMQLDSAALSSLLPQQLEPWMAVTGQGLFDSTGALLEVSLSAATTQPDVFVGITLSEQAPSRCYVLPEEPVRTVCNGVEYTLYRYDSGQWILLDAEAIIGSVYLRFSLQCPDDAVVQDDFEQILGCFSTYDDGKPDLQKIKADEIPEWFDWQLTFEEAAQDPAFGSLWLPELPDGFTEESIRRYKDQNSNSLSGLWTKGYDQLSWQVSFFGEEDAARCVRAGEPEKYDLRLYPIPRAQSVPDELQEVVNNPIFDAEELTPELVQTRAYRADEQGDSNGWRMYFSVRYDDRLVTVQTKGIEPDWLFARLQAMKP